MGTWPQRLLPACFWLLGESILLLLCWGVGNNLLLEIAVPGTSSGKEAKKLVKRSIWRAEHSLAHEARVNSLGWFLLACWGLPRNLSSSKA